MQLEKLGQQGPGPTAPPKEVNDQEFQPSWDRFGTSGNSYIEEKLEEKPGADNKDIHWSMPTIGTADNR